MFNEVVCVAEIRRCYAVRDPASSKSRVQTTATLGPLVSSCNSARGGAVLPRTFAFWQYLEYTTHNPDGTGLRALRSGQTPQMSGGSATFMAYPSKLGGNTEDIDHANHTISAVADGFRGERRELFASTCAVIVVLYADRESRRRALANSRGWVHIGPRVQGARVAISGGASDIARSRLRQSRNRSCVRER